MLSHYDKLTYPHVRLGGRVSQLCLEPGVVWARSQYLPATGALCPGPSQKQLAFVAALVAVAVIAAMLLPSGLE